MNKVIKLSILIIVPVLATFLMGLYGYNHYQNGNQIKYDYYEQAEDNTVSQLKYFMKYNEDKYEEAPVYKQNVTNSSGEKLLTFEIYRASYYKKELVNNEETQVEYARYIFVGYDVDYDKIKDLFDFDSNSAKNDASTPSLKLVLTPINLDIFDVEDTFEINLTNKSRSYDGLFNIVDYNATPLKDEPDPYVSSSHIGAIYTRWNVEESYNANFGVNFNMTLEATSSLYDETLVLDDELLAVDYRFNKKVSQYENYSPTLGYSNNEIKAGYFGWVFKNYLWWICLTSFIVIGFLTYTFVLVWESEDNSNSNKNSVSDKNSNNIKSKNK